MKKLMKNSEWIKRGLVAFMGLSIMIIAIVMFALSFGSYDDGYGTDISFDMDFVILFICGIALLVYGIYTIYAYHKNLSTKLAYYGAFGIISVLIAFYPLGVFFKAISKGKPYLENQEYLYAGILGLIMIAFLIFSYISDQKRKEQ